MRRLKITILWLLSTPFAPALADTYQLGPKVVLEQSSDGTLYATRRNEPPTPTERHPLDAFNQLYAGKVRISARRKVRSTFVVRQEIFVLDRAGRLWTIDKSTAYYKARMFLRNAAVLAVPFAGTILLDKFDLIQDPLTAAVLRPDQAAGSYLIMAILGIMAPAPFMVGILPTFDGFNFFKRRVAKDVREVVARPDGDYDVVVGGPRPDSVRLTSFVPPARPETCQQWLEWWW